MENEEIKVRNQGTAALVPEALKAWAQKYESKNDNYGNSWLLTGQTLALWFPQGLTLNTPRRQIMHGLVTRMLDKIIRAANIELAGVEDKVGEKASESLFDLGVYAFMAGAACFMEAGKVAFDEALKRMAAVVPPQG